MSQSHPVTNDFKHIGWLTAAPLVWSVHFAASYLTNAIWCAKFAGDDGSATQVRIMIAGYTAVAMVIIAIIGFAGYRRHRLDHSKPPHDSASPEDHRRFVGYSTFLLALLSAVATLFTALVAFFLETCD